VAGALTVVAFPFVGAWGSEASGLREALREDRRSGPIRGPGPAPRAALFARWALLRRRSGVTAVPFFDAGRFYSRRSFGQRQPIFVSPGHAWNPEFVPSDWSGSRKPFIQSGARDLGLQAETVGGANLRTRGDVNETPCVDSCCRAIWQRCFCRAFKNQHFKSTVVCC